ncbi:hypothetical protein DRO59_00300 [Candidatus Bathyarchaeota archaeon]|nr:MAG: hypothetical protein DRO59_00300 [Candidatus Bathyarchaeota archaeon]
MEKRRYMPTKEEIREKAIEIYYREHPKARELGITPEEYELRPPEGRYYLKAQQELMAGIRSELERTLNEYKREIEDIVEVLKEMKAKPPEWALPKEELEAKITRLQNKIVRLEAAKEKAEKEKEKISKVLTETRKILSEKEAELARKREMEKRYIYKMATIKTTQYIPAFTGVDGKVYGSFYPNQIATIPEADADKLIRQGKAQPWAISKAKPTPPKKEELRKQAEAAFAELATAVEHDLYYETDEALEKLREIGVKAHSV